MLFLSRTRLLLSLALLACILATAGSSRGQGAKKPGKSDPVKFKTFDGVTLHGTYYANASGKNNAVVLLLHEPDLKKGGSSQQDGWAELATALQQAGYVVLMFDFRGFGESKEVDSETFSRHSQNMTLIRGITKKTSQIDHKNFMARYMPYLVNDIAAAKAFLDRRNDAKECNTSNLIVIGAGEGATLGSLWMAHEARRRKDKNPNSILGGPAILGEPESKDIAAGVWLTISPRLGGITVPLKGLVGEVAGRDGKVPMAFVYGKSDATADTLARGLVSHVTPKGSKSKDAKLTNIQPIPDTKLAGHKLLGKDSETESFIIKKYLPSVMEARTAHERVERKVETSTFWYTARGGSQPMRINKKAGEDVPSVHLSLFLQMP